MLEVREKEEGVVALHLPIAIIMIMIMPLKTCSGLEQLLRCEPSTYQPIADDIVTTPQGPVQVHVVIP